METSFLTPEVIAALLTSFVSIAGAYGFNLKKKIGLAKDLITEIETANADNNITAEEFTGIVKTAKKLIS
ncbi:MAG: hypothetical protein KDC82_07105 [Bacteroidetes bacterium]|nr:hypothetical protein [Bacteroidota bacterium]